MKKIYIPLDILTIIQRLINKKIYLLRKKKMKWNTKTYQKNLDQENVPESTKANELPVSIDALFSKDLRYFNQCDGESLLDHKHYCIEQMNIKNEMIKNLKKDSLHWILQKNMIHRPCAIYRYGGTKQYCWKQLKKCDKRFPKPNHTET